MPGQGTSTSILQDLQLLLYGPAFAFPAELTPNALHLRRSMRTLVLNRITDFLRRERVIPKVRCGACLHFLEQGHLRARDGAGTSAAAEIPNPHCGKVIDPHTNPEALAPRVPSSSGVIAARPSKVSPRQRPRRRRPWEKKGTRAAAACPRLLLREEPAGRRQGHIIDEHFAKDRPANAIAAELGVSERTVRRDVQAGLAALHRILTDEMGLTHEDLA